MSPSEIMALVRPPRKGEPNRLLQTVRRDRGIKLGKVSELVGVSVGFYNQIELGKNLPSLAVALRIAKFWGLTVEQIWGENDAAAQEGPRVDTPPEGSNGAGVGGS